MDDKSGALPGACTNRDASPFPNPSNPTQPAETHPFTETQVTIHRWDCSTDLDGCQTKV